jgi:hypothetical protein
LGDYTHGVVGLGRVLERPPLLQADQRATWVLHSGDGERGLRGIVEEKNV